ncbi:MAG: putative ABC transporter permease subunit [Myxococcota bacterium]
MSRVSEHQGDVHFAGARALVAGLKTKARLWQRRAARERERGVPRLLGILALIFATAMAVYFAAATAGYWLRLRAATEFVQPALSVVYLGVFGALLLSCLGHCASAFFTAQDLWFWNASAAPRWARFTDRVVEAGAGALPATLALGGIALVGFLRGADMPLALMRSLLALFLVAQLPLGLSVCAAHIGGAVLPAGRLRRWSLVVVGVVVTVFLGAFRRARLERLVTEEGAAQFLAQQQSFTEVGPRWLPSNLAARFAVEGRITPLLELCGLVVLAYTLAYLAHKALYLRARDLADDESPTGLRAGSWAEKAQRRFAAIAPRPLRPLLAKDLLVFVRDPAQWSQLVLLLGIAVIYLVNLEALRLGFEPFPWAKDVFLGGMHVGLATFIAAGLAARFAFPQMGLEGPAVWFLEASPLEPREVLQAKTIASLPVVCAFPTIVAAIGGGVLGLSPFLWVLTTVTVASVSAALAALGTGRGSVIPIFDAVSVSELAMGPGALSTMVLAVGVAGTASLFSMLGGALLRFGGPVVGPAGAVCCALLPSALAMWLARRALTAGSDALCRRREEGPSRSGGYAGGVKC